MLGSMLHVPGFDVDTIEQVRAKAVPADVHAHLSNQCSAAIDTSPAAGEPCVATIYQLDGLVRRAASLQQTTDAKATGGL